MTQILPNPLEGINYLDQYYKVKSMITRSVRFNVIIPSDEFNT